MACARPRTLSWSVAALLAAALLAAALLAAGCGSGSSLLAGQTHRHATRNQPNVQLPGLRTIPVPSPTGRPADPAAVRVIEAWSRALQHGDIRTAASYFNLPSELINGVAAGGVVSLIMIHTRTQAEAANEALPCGATFISADQRGKFVNALFKLTGRAGAGGSDCGSGAGATARTNFLIEAGRIVAWIRAPDDPGDNGSPRAPGSPSTPADPSSPGSPSTPADPSSPGGTPLV